VKNGIAGIRAILMLILLSKHIGPFGQNELELIGDEHRIPFKFGERQHRSLAE
jgi:hypothetical protein